MYLRIIKNDFYKNRVITLVITLFVAAAAMLVALAALLAVNLTAVDTLMTQAKTPHFMQMHSAGPMNAAPLDRLRLERFAQQNNQVDEWQVLEFLNIDGAEMVFPGTSLAGNLQDNGLCVQSEQFDYLLGLDGAILHPKDGELYVPICYLRDNTAKLGDSAVIRGKTFTVAGFLRDSQMNSALSSSKRFLVSKKDFAQMRGSGHTEYLIEFRLKDLSTLGAFETAYTTAGLPANGPTVTYSLFKTMNGFSDGMLIGLLILVSVLVVAVALLCIRFTLLAKIEEDHREIGVMKAIGLPISQIKRIYLAKYAVIAALGCTLGSLLALAFGDLLTQSIHLYLGESESAALAPLFAILGVLLVFFAILAYVGGVLRRLRKQSAAEALRFGTTQEKSGGAKQFCIRNNSVLPTNLFLGLQDVFARKRLYTTMFSVVLMATFLLIVPQNLYHTISAQDFGRYMGIGTYDLRLDLQQTGNNVQTANEIKAAMEVDPAIKQSVILTTKAFRTNTGERLKVELGDHSVFPVAYVSGTAPTHANEIALSVMNADALAKQVGERILLDRNGSEQALTVCGIYSDITNGGKTAKAVFEDHSTDPMWSILCVKVAEQSQLAGITREYAQRFPDAKIASIHDYITQTFGQTIRSVKAASQAAIVIALFLTVLVTLLFMQLLISKDRYSIAVMKVIGFTNKDITMQYVARAVFVLVLGALCGTVMANTLGEALGGLVISAFGASSFQFTIHPLWAYLLSPLMMVGAVLVGVLLGTRHTGQIKLSQTMKEG